MRIAALFLTLGRQAFQCGVALMALMGACVAVLALWAGFSLIRGHEGFIRLCGELVVLGAFIFLAGLGLMVATAFFGWNRGGV